MSWFRSSRRQRSPAAEGPPETTEAAEAAEAVETVPRPARSELEGKSLADLHELAAGAGIERYRLLRREQLIGEISGETTVPLRRPGRGGEARRSRSPVGKRARCYPRRESKTSKVSCAPACSTWSPTATASCAWTVWCARTAILRAAHARAADTACASGEGGLGLGAHHARSERQPRLVSVETVEGRPASERRDPGPSTRRRARSSGRAGRCCPAARGCGRRSHGWTSRRAARPRDSGA